MRHTVDTGHRYSPFPWDGEGFVFVILLPPFHLFLAPSAHTSHRYSECSFLCLGTAVKVSLEAGAVLVLLASPR